MSAVLPTSILLDANIGWRLSRVDASLCVERDGILRLRPIPASGRPLVDDAGSFGGLAAPTGLAVDPDGTLYVLDGRRHEIRYFDSCNGQFVALSCVGGRGPEPRQMLHPHGIAANARGDLLVADTGNRRIQVFTRKGLALRSIWGPWRVIDDGDVRRVARVTPTSAARPVDCQPPPLAFPDQTWTPWDVAVAADCTVYVSDWSNGLIHVLDDEGCWICAYDGSGEAAEPLERPTHIALDGEGQLYVIEEGKRTVRVLGPDGQFLREVVLTSDIPEVFPPQSLAVSEDGTLLIADGIGRRVHHYCRTADGGYAYVGSSRAPDGPVTALAFDLAGNPLVGQSGANRVEVLEPDLRYETGGTYYSDALDSRRYRCTWHRVILDGVVEHGTQVRVETFTSEVAKTSAEIQALDDTRWATHQLRSRPDEGRWDCLISSPRGRYLWLRLTLMGNGTGTPTLRSVRVEFPRNSSMQYLPAAYQQDEPSARFLDRFLSLFDTLRGGIATQVGEAARYFDPAATPAGADGDPDFLTWLASWLGLALDLSWPESKRRRLVERAHELYRLRGTVEGLKLHVELFTGITPAVIEHYRLRRWLQVGSSSVGDQSALWGPDVVRRLQLDVFSQLGLIQLVDAGDPLRDPFHVFAHQFSVYAPLPPCSDVEETQRTLRRIVEMAKPAHTMARVDLVRPRMRVGVQSIVGVNTVVAQYPRGVQEGRTRLGYDSLLDESEDERNPPTMRVGVRSRVGSTSRLD